jgi:competence protein ComEC
MLTLADVCAAGVSGLAALPAGLWFGWPWVAPAGVVLGVGGALLALALGSLAIRLAALGCLLLVLAHSSPDHDPMFSVLDVGQGDALLLRDGPRAVLVDGGGWPRGDLGGRVLVPALAARRISSLDAVILTHADRDHCQGLVDVAHYVRIAELWTDAHSLSQPCGQALAAQTGRVRVLKVGQELAVGRWRLTILATGDDPASRGFGANDRSVVVGAEVHGRRILLTGDIERAGEARLLDGDRSALVADLLKVAHHGSRTSTNAAWLAATRPRWALVSAGVGNPYGHPAGEVMARLLAAGVHVLRTDRDGALEVRVQPGGRLRVRAVGWGKLGREGQAKIRR